MTNLFADVPSGAPNEVLEALLEADELRIERIVSYGQATPPYFWYDQPRHEWIVLLKGAARLRLEGEEQEVTMKSDDFLNIPAGQRHRVEWTTPDEPTLWLAIHYGAQR
jgi:cupin 2 domain-containing protein